MVVSMIRTDVWVVKGWDSHEKAQKAQKARGWIGLDGWGCVARSGLAAVDGGFGAPLGG